MGISSVLQRDQGFCFAEKSYTHQRESKPPVCFNNLKLNFMQLSKEPSGFLPVLSYLLEKIFNKVSRFKNVSIELSHLLVRIVKNLHSTWNWRTRFQRNFREKQSWEGMYHLKSPLLHMYKCCTTCSNTVIWHFTRLQKFSVN